MATKSAIVVSSHSTLTNRLKSDLALIGYSECIIISSVENLSIKEKILNPTLVIIEFNERTEDQLVLNKISINKLFGLDVLLLVCTEQLIAERLVKLGLIEKHGYICLNYTLRELELCVNACELCKTSPTENEVGLNGMLYNTLFELSSNGFIIGDESGKILSANPAVCRILGYNREDLLKMQLHDLLPNISKDVVDQSIMHVVSGKAHHIEIIDVNKEGKQKYLDIIETRITIYGGRFGVLLVVSDITERKEAEEALKESEEKYRILVEKSNDGIVFVQDGIIIYGNPKIMEIIGATSNDFIGSQIETFFHADEREKVVDRYKRRLSGENIPSIYETVIKSNSGISIPVEFNVNIVNYQGKATTMIFIRNITSRKATEKFLKEGEESYRSLFDNASDAIYIQDENGIFLDANKAALNLYGYSKSEILGSTPRMLSASGRNDIDAAFQRVKNAYAGKSEFFEFWGITKSGRIFPTELVLNNGRYFGKDIVFAIVRDISERKNAEEVLRESEDKYRTLTEQIPVGIYRTTEDGRSIYANPALANILGYNSVDELMLANINDFYPEKGERVQHINAIKTGSLPLGTEFQLIRKDGKYIWVRDSAHITYGSNGEILYIDGVIENITEQKEADKALVESEANLRATLNAIPDLLFRINRDGIYLEFLSEHNDSYKTPLERIIGASLNDFFPTDIAEKIHSSILKCLDTGELQTIEYPIKNNNNVQFFEARLVAANKNEAFCLARDITNRKRAEEEITMLAQTIMNVNDCISITDTNDKFIYVNHAFLQTYGYTSEELIGKQISIVRHSSITEAKSVEIHTQTLLGGWKGELFNVRKDGSIFPISLSSAVIRDENGNPLATVGISNDITESKKVEQELINAKEKAEESDRLKTAFLANMSHEIRSPMNAILGFIRFLKEEEKLTENGKQYIELITNSSKQLLSVINDIIDTSKIQANQLRLSKHEFDLNMLFSDLYAIFSSHLAAKVDKKTILLPPVLSNASPFLITSDDLRIRQILTNLLSNAIKFTPNGYIEFGYLVVIDDANSFIKFFVKDTGIGLAPDKRNLIFERFRQADDSYTRMYGGSGLGLAISKGLTDLLGGRIWVESEEGKGSAFFVTLPLESVLDINVDDKKSEDALKLDRLQGLNWFNKTILIVEDLKEVQIFFKKMLNKTNANLIFAGTAKEARLAFSKHDNIDLILLDLRLPDLDGYDLAVEFKSKRPEIPIVAQTAYAMQDEQEKSESFGCDDYITKPIDADQLYLKISKFLKN